MSDVVARAREALEDLDAADWSLFKTRSRCWPVGDDTHAVMNWCQLARQLVPELVAALEQARELSHHPDCQQEGTE